MKHYLIYSILSIALLFTATSVLAATTSPTPAVSTSEEQINNLQERVASRVAQLNLVQKRGFIGTVTDTAETQITVKDMMGNARSIDVDELTKFSSPSVKTSFGISDITKGTVIGVIGLYNKDSQRLLARFVDELNLPKVVSGGILSVNSDTFTFTIATAGNNTANIDVENITKTSVYTQTGGLVRAGFSKLTVGKRVQIVGYPDAKDNTLLVASRILIFPDLPVDPKITLINPTDIAPISTGSGKKLTPITR